MFISVLRDLVPAERLAEVQDHVRRAAFVSGEISGGTAETKRNLEIPPDDDRYLPVLKLVEGAVRESLEFKFTAFPRYMTRPIISRYDAGMFYGEHTDFPVMNFITTANISAAHRDLAPVGHNYLRSDLSMTLFLSDPETYDGGELAFPGAWEQLAFKLPAGSAVVYPTGARHEVRRVTRGVRLAAIFWIQTMLPVEAHRRVVHQSFDLARRLESSLPGSEECRLAEEISHNTFRSLSAV